MAVAVASISSRYWAHAVSGMAENAVIQFLHYLHRESSCLARNTIRGLNELLKLTIAVCLVVNVGTDVAKTCSLGTFIQVG